MCQIYTGIDPFLCTSRTRALRIHGVVTTVRLENLFWNVLQEIAERESLTLSQFVTKLSDELLARHKEKPINFASFLRVCCLRYLSQNISLQSHPVQLHSGHDYACANEVSAIRSV
jgi:predicted DNA-binding ribbon-helix-helix protein